MQNGKHVEIEAMRQRCAGDHIRNCVGREGGLPLIMFQVGSNSIHTKPASVTAYLRYYYYYKSVHAANSQQYKTSK